MSASLIRWLHDIALQAVFVSVTLLVIVNGAFAAGVIVRRDRAFVNRWTGRVLAVDLALVGMGAGVPALAAGARFVVRTLVPSIHAELRAPGFFAPPLGDPPNASGAAREPSERRVP